MKIIETGTTRKLGYGFLFAFGTMAVCCIISEIKRAARYWLKIAIFSYSLHSTPALWGSRRNIAILFGTEKLEWWGYLMVKKN